MSFSIPLAHGIGGVRDPVIPLWLFYYGAALVLIVSFAALGALWRRPLLERLALSRDGKRVAATNENDKEHATVFELPGGKPLMKAWHGSGDDALTGVALSPDGSKLTAGGSRTAARVKVWEVDSQRQRASLAGLKEGAISLAFSPDGQSLAAADGFRGVLLWDVTGGQPLLGEPLKGALPVEDLAYSPDGRLLAGATREQVHVWEVVSGQEVLLLRGAPRRPRPDDFNPRIAWADLSFVAVPVTV